MLRLRVHHLNCIPRFQGRGYSDEFCDNMQKIRKRFDDGEEYIIVSDADDVCKACPNLRDGVCRDEEKVSLYDTLSMSENSIDKICTDCKWYTICKKM